MSPPSADATRESAFHRLYDRTYPDLLRFVQRRAHPDHAEDVVADVYLVAWRQFADLPPREDETRAWLFGVARQLLLNARRGQTRYQALAVRIAQMGSIEVSTAADEIELAAHRIDLATVWPRLSATDQEALALAVLDGLSAAEAALVLHISAVAFRLRLSRARQALRRHLHQLDDTPRPTRSRLATVPQEDTP